MKQKAGFLSLMKRYLHSVDAADPYLEQLHEEEVTEEFTLYRLISTVTNPRFSLSA